MTQEGPRHPKRERKGNEGRASESKSNSKIKANIKKHKQTAKSESKSKN